jgi:hypothetical protein
MKHRIAGFLGELAEELGWTPEFEQARVKPETTEITPIRVPRVLTPDDDSPALRATPVERMQAELNQLHSTVKHLGSEVINLRAQMAQLRSVPVPPDAKPQPTDDGDAHARTGSVPRDCDRPGETCTGQDESSAHLSAATAVEPVERPWPPRLIPVPAPVVPDPDGASSQPRRDTEAAESASPSEVPAPTPATAEVPGLTAQPDPAGSVEIAQAPSADETPAGPVIEASAQPTEVESGARSASVPTIIEIGDSPESGLELFPSEPDSSENVTAGAGASTPTDDTGRSSKRRKRRRRDWTGSRI